VLPDVCDDKTKSENEEIKTAHTDLVKKASLNTKNKIKQKSDKQKLRKENENTNRKASTKTMKKSKSVIFTSKDIDDFNPNKNQDTKSGTKAKSQNGEIKIISETSTTTILSKSLSNINYFALEDEDCKNNENCKDEVEETESKLSKLEMNSKEIAKHMIVNDKHSLQRFKKATNSKGVPHEDSYQEMCTKTKAYGGIGRRIFDKKEMFDEDDGGCAERIKNAKPKTMDDISSKNYQNGRSNPIQYGLWDECDQKEQKAIKKWQKTLRTFLIMREQSKRKMKCKNS
jgi:hypothetical protein